MRRLNSLTGFAAGRRVSSAAATWIGGVSYNNVPNPQVISFPGAVAGDLGFIFMTYWGSPPSGISGWTVTTESWANHGYFSYVARKVLTSGDISSPPSVGGSNSGNVMDVGYIRGATSLVRRNGADELSSSSMTLTGFVPNASTKGALIFTSTRNPEDAFNVPSGWTRRAALHFGTYFMGAVDHKPDYTGGDVTITGFSSGDGLGSHASIWEAL